MLEYTMYRALKPTLRAIRADNPSYTPGAVMNDLGSSRDRRRVVAAVVMGIVYGVYEWWWRDYRNRSKYICLSLYISKPFSRGPRPTSGGDHVLLYRAWVISLFSRFCLVELVENHVILVEFTIHELRLAE